MNRKTNGTLHSKAANCVGGDDDTDDDDEEDGHEMPSCSRTRFKVGTN